MNLPPLFDGTRFDQQIINAINHSDKLKLFQSVLTDLDKNLASRYAQNIPIEDLVAGRAYVLDELLVRIWRLYFKNEGRQISLVAVGGYGRGELHPKSDIDLLILLKKHNNKEFNSKIQHFLTFLWDIKLEVGHSVRSLKDCTREAKADITVATNMMEARLLTGDNSLYERMTYLTSAKKIWPSKKFFAEKWLEQQFRHRKFHDTAYNLEPNVKEGPGGLRDIQMIGWVAKRHFGADTLHELLDHNFLTSKELTDLLEGQATLWKVRFALHMLTKRREDRLLFDYQRELAVEFGYEDTHVIAVEQFMQNYFKTVVQLERLNEMLLQHFQEEILDYKKNQKVKYINSRFQNNRGFIEVTDVTVFEKFPSALLEIFLLLETEDNIQGVRASTIRLIRDNVNLIDDEFRQDEDNRRLFISILEQAKGVTHELRRMNRYGVLAAYLPEFANIVGRMQYDLFHHYTVDEHTLFVVRNMRRFTVAKYENEFPLCSDLIKQLPNQALLYISGLYHDIAKGRGGNHSELGAEDAHKFCLNHFLSEFDAQLVEWLVKNHLIFSMTAQTKDTSDASVINEFASLVGDKLHLDYLYLLTVADIRATNPNTWNTWKASLLEELYRNTKNALQRGLDNPIAQQERMQSNIDAAKDLLLKNNISETEIQSVWQHLGKSYFFRHHPEEICWHTQEIILSNEKQLPIVSIHSQELRGSTPIFIYDKIRRSTFYNITSKLEQLQVNILDARLISNENNYALNTFLVLENNGHLITEKARLKHIQDELRVCLLQTNQTEISIIRHYRNRQLNYMDIKTKIIFGQDKKGERTIIKINTADRPGLLSRIAFAFRECEIKLQNARISSFGETAEDTFVITNQQNHFLQPEEEEKLKATILEKIAG